MGCSIRYGYVDSSIVVIGIPTILQNLHASIVTGVWIITGYKLMLTTLLIMIGRLADLYSKVKLYNLGFVIFTVGSLLCALSRTGEQLVIFRFLQGTGAALLYANSIVAPVIFANSMEPTAKSSRRWASKCG